MHSAPTRRGSQGGSVAAAGGCLLLGLFALWIATTSITALQGDVTAYCTPDASCNRGQLQTGYVSSMLSGFTAVAMFAASGFAAVIAAMRHRPLPKWSIIAGASALIPLGAAFVAVLVVEWLDGVPA
jgi:hypothetical protein